MDKKVLFISAEGSIIGGGEISLIELVKNLEKYKPVVILPERGNLEEVLNEHNIRYYIVDFRKRKDFLYLFVLAKKIKDIVLKEKISIIHSNAASSKETFISCIVAKLLKIPFIWHVRIGEKRLIFDFFVSWLSNKVIVNSCFVKKRFFCFKNKIEVVYNGVDLDKIRFLSNRREVRNKLGSGDNEILIGDVTRFDKWKKLDFFIEVAEVLKNKVNNLKFILIGEGKEEKRLKEKVHKLNLSDKFIFTGFKKDVLNILQGIDVIFHPAEGEHFGRVIIEGMAVGVVVVAHNSGGVPEIIKNNYSGILFSEFNKNRVADMLEKVVKDFNLRKSLIINAKKEIEKFDIRKHSKNVEKIYDEVLKKKLLFICPFFTSFIKRDIEILKKYFNVKILNYKRRTDFFKLLFYFFKTDIIFSWFVFTYATVSAVFGKLSGKKTVVVIGGGDIANLPEIKYGIMQNPISRIKVKIALKLSNKVIANSEFLKNQILHYIRLKNIKVIYPGIDYNKFKPDKQKKENTVMTVSIGMKKLHIELKGLKTFINVAKKLPDIKFVLVGGNLDEDRAGLEKQSPSNVIFPGFISNEELVNYYQRAKVYCQLSKYEGFGCALAESMACECVPVVTSCGALPEVVGNTGYIVPYGDVEKTVEAINKALKDEEKGVLARERAKKFFDLRIREKNLINELENF